MLPTFHETERGGGKGRWEGKGDRREKQEKWRGKMVL